MNDLVQDGFVEDIASDFGFIYYKKIDFEGSKQLLNELNNTKSAKFKQFVSAFVTDGNDYLEDHEDDDKKDDDGSEHKHNSRDNKKRKAMRDKLIKEIKIKQVLYQCSTQWKERIGTTTSTRFLEN